MEWTRTAWTSTHDRTAHPDTGAAITGEQLNDTAMKDVLAFAASAHAKLLPCVPLSGWDVALTRDHGMLMLECNLSCNFFRKCFLVAWLSWAHFCRG